MAYARTRATEQVTPKADQPPKAVRAIFPKLPGFGVTCRCLETICQRKEPGQAPLVYCNSVADQIHESPIPAYAARIGDAVHLQDAKRPQVHHNTPECICYCAGRRKCYFD